MSGRLHEAPRGGWCEAVGLLEGMGERVGWVSGCVVAQGSLRGRKYANLAGTLLQYDTGVPCLSVP